MYEKNRIIQLNNDATVMSQKYNKVKKALFAMKDKAKTEHQEGSEAIEDLRKLSEAHAKLQTEHDQL